MFLLPEHVQCEASTAEKVFSQPPIVASSPT